MPRQLLPIHKYQHLNSTSNTNLKPNQIKVKYHSRPYKFALKAGAMLFRGKMLTVELMAKGESIPRLIQTVEFMRKRVNNISFSYRVDSISIEDVYEPLERGLDRVIIKKWVPQLVAELILIGDWVDDSEFGVSSNQVMNSGERKFIKAVDKYIERKKAKQAGLSIQRPVKVFRPPKIIKDQNINNNKNKFKIQRQKNRMKGDKSTLADQLTSKTVSKYKVGLENKRRLSNAIQNLHLINQTHNLKMLRSIVKDKEVSESGLTKARKCSIFSCADNN